MQIDGMDGESPVPLHVLAILSGVCPSNILGRHQKRTSIRGAVRVSGTMRAAHSQVAS